MAFGLGRSTATVKLAADTAGFNRDIDRAQGNFRRSTGAMERDVKQMTRGTIAGSGALRGFGRSIAFASGAFLGAAGFSAAIRGAFDELNNATKVSAQTAAVLKSTGGAANVTAGQVDRLAQQLLRVSGVDDEVIKSGENMLLTFTSIRNEAGKGNDIFTQSTKVLLDMSTALGTDMSKSAIQLGKALNDPIKGITALRRVGVQFTDDQQKQIKALVDSGQKMEAQKLILRELQVEFGGSAKAAGNTFGGQINKLRETLRNMSAELLKQLIPSIEKITKRLQNWLENTRNQQKIQETFNSIVRTTTTIVKVLKDVFDLLWPVLKIATRAVGGLTHAIELLLLLGAARKIQALSGSFGTGRGGLAGNVGVATGKVGGLKGALAGLPTKLVIQVAIATAIYGPAKKLFEKYLGADYSGIAPDAPSSPGSAYPKGTTGGDAYQRGKSGKPPLATYSPAEMKAYNAGKKARQADRSIQSVAPSPTSTPSGTQNVLRDAQQTSSGGGGTAAGASTAGAYAGSVSLAAGADRGGVHTKTHVIAFVRRISSIVGKPLTITTGTNHNENVAGTNRQSDHWTGNAADIPASGASLTRLGQAALQAAGASPTAAARQNGGAYNVGGVNILFNTNIGGNHFNHCHVGLHALPAGGGGSDSGQTLTVSGKPKGPGAPTWNLVDAKGRPIAGGRGGGIGGGGGGAGIGGASGGQSIKDKLSGISQQTVNIPGIGKILVNVTTKPSKESVAKIIQELIVKIKAAKARLAKFQKALGIELRRRHRKASLISHLRARIKATQIIIRDLLVDLGLAYDEFTVLNTETEDEKKADEGDGGGGGGGGGGGESAPFDPTASSQVPLELRSAAAAASLTPGLEDDIAVLKQEESLFSSRLSSSTDPEERIALTEKLLQTRGSLSSIITQRLTDVPAGLRFAQVQARGTRGDPSDDISVVQAQIGLTQMRLGEADAIEDQITLTDRLISLQDELTGLETQRLTTIPAQIRLEQAKARLTAAGDDDEAVRKKIEALVRTRLAEATAIEDQIALTNQLADLQGQLNHENQEMIAYLSDLRQLSRQGSNLYVPTGGTSGITLNTYVSSPAGGDPHLLSNTIAFELQALLG